MPQSLQPLRTLRATPDFRWPDGKRVALVFNIAFEAWSEGEAPGIGPMGNVLKPGYFDTNADSWAKYGPTRGIQRLSRIAQANGVRTSVMTNGVLAERAPDAVRALHAAGHDVYAHSWGMDVIPVYLDEAAARANVERNTRALEAVTGEAPVGWISPRGTGAPSFPGMLAQAGYLWHGDCNDDDLPSIDEYDDGAGGVRRLVRIPLTMDVNDLPHCIRYGNAPATLIDQFEDILENALQADDQPFMLDVTAHTHVFGRPSGAWAYDAMMKIALERDDVWIATRREIAHYALAQADLGAIA
ncbi:MAG: polysaccharide deacetylase [Hyphomicrobiales bacterium]|nr:polysaccharide deacetylase [Hyphomicrobiales bacterium]